MHKPLVNIGMAVYNSEKYLEIALNSLLNQDFDDFDIFISDDGSTDQSQNICQSFVKKDARIKYYRQPQNLGAIGNLNFVARKATGRYFMWAGVDDYWDRTMLSKLVTIMEENTGLAAACSGTERIDENGKHLFYYNRNHPDTSLNEDRIERIRTVYRYSAPSTIEGLLRVSILRKTSYFRFGVIPEDMFLLAELSIYGGIKGTKEVLFHKREGGINLTKSDIHFRQKNVIGRTFSCIEDLPITKREKRIMKYEIIRSITRRFFIVLVTDIFNRMGIKLQFVEKKIHRLKA